MQRVAKDRTIVSVDVEGYLVDDADRRQADIEGAIQRLLAGKPIQSDGSLTAVTLAIEAGVSRATMYRRYRHLVDEFTVQAESFGARRVSASERALCAQIDALKREATQRADELRRIRVARETMANAVYALWSDNLALRDTLAATKSNVSAPNPEPRTHQHGNPQDQHYRNCH